MELIMIFYTSAVWCLNCNNYIDTVNRAILAANVDNCCELRVIDVTDNPPKRTRMLDRLPTLIITDQEGTEVTRLTGFKSVTSLVEWIEYNTQN